jgi:hypothetical protein
MYKGQRNRKRQELATTFKRFKGSDGRMVIRNPSQNEEQKEEEKPPKQIEGQENAADKTMIIY